MEVKEAIEKIKIWYRTYLANCTSIFNDDETICKIIELFQRGEKFEKMWEELKDNYLDHDYCLVITEEQRKELEQKYFPKEKSLNE